MKYSQSQEVFLLLQTQENTAKIQSIVNKGIKNYSLQDINVEDIQFLGRGGFGDVYLSNLTIKQTAQSSLIAIKRLFTYKGQKPDEFIKNLINEIELLSNVRNHKNIVSLLGIIVEMEQIALILEYCPGDFYKTVSAIARPLTEENMIGVLQHLKQIAEGLHFLHACLILHRDMKPQNILISENGTAKLIDFGISRQMKFSDYSNQMQWLQTQQIGTINFLSPEVLTSQLLTEKSDVWSLGGVIY